MVHILEQTRLLFDHAWHRDVVSHLDVLEQSFDVWVVAIFIKLVHFFNLELP